MKVHTNVHPHVHPRTQKFSSHPFHSKPGISLRPCPIYTVPQLLQREEDKNSCRLETGPRGQPAFEHEHRALVGEGVTNHRKGGLERVKFKKGKGW